MTREVESAPLKIAVNPIGGTAWIAGNVLIRDLALALRETYGPRVALAALAHGAPAPLPRDLDGLLDGHASYPTFRRFTLKGLLDRAARRVLGRDLLGDRALRAQGICAVAFGNTPRGSGVPTLALIPDFQHAHFPEMFTPQERAERDRGFERAARLSTRVLVFGEEVQRDCEKFLPAHAHKVRVLDPVSFIDPSVYAAPEDVCELYHLPRKFVYLPNQFWKHKNHRMAFAALRTLRQRGLEVFLVCTGFPGDYRNAGHFAELLQTLSQWGLRDQVALLGMVPRAHVPLLVRQSVCVLNPSLFEGFGLSVAEARSLGKRIVASDIPAHRDQGPPGAVYFDPLAPDDLARKLADIWLARDGGPDEDLEPAARQAMPARARAYARRFMAIVREATGRECPEERPLVSANLVSTVSHGA